MIKAEPFDFPCDGNLDPGATALHMVTVENHAFCTDSAAVFDAPMRLPKAGARNGR